MPYGTVGKYCRVVASGGVCGGRAGVAGWVVLLVGMGFAASGAGAQTRAVTGTTASTRQMRARQFLAGRAALRQTAVPAAEMLARARGEHQALLARPRDSSLGAAWTAVGPAQVSTPAYGVVTGRVTSLALDPADGTGNTLYLGTTGGGVWKSVNAAGSAASVSFVPLTDTLPVFSANAGSSATASLSIGALGMSGGGVLLAGTGDPNDASDSYYGSGMLRSTDGGTTWSLIQGSHDGVAGNHSFFGLSFTGFAFSTVTPSLMVAGVGQAAEGVLVNAPDGANSVMGLYFSTDAGVTWQMASIYDGSQPVQTPQPSGGNQGGNAATAVVWNPLRQRFYAAVQFHGYYESADGQSWTRLAHQPGVGLTAAACPTDPGSTGSVGCPIFRGVLAVQPASGDLFALTVDASDQDQGLWQDVCAAQARTCASATVLFGTELGGTVGASPLEQGSGSTAIAQGDYDLALAAVADGTDTKVYVGTLDLFRCSVAQGCVLRNTTNVQNGCTQPAGVAGAQHALAASAGGPMVYLGNDGGIYRSSDGVAETGPACSASDAGHFENLNGGLGSLAEVVSFAQDPSDPGTLLTGLGALGTAGTGSAVEAWPQLAAGEGGTVAIDPANPLNWYLSTGAGVSIGRCTSGGQCGAAEFAAVPVVGEAQVDEDDAAIHAPWLLDPGLTSGLIVGTCRVWRGLATGVGWPGMNELSSPFGAASASGCSSTFPVVRSLGAGGTVNMAGAAVNQGSEVVYAGLAGSLNGGGGLGGHLFATKAAEMAGAATAWTDVALNPVTNAASDQGVFNPGGFDLSAVTVDTHDATGATVYATVMGFAANGVNAPHVYRSADGGGHWLNISSNLPNAPANSLVVDPNDANTVYVAMDTGVYVTQGVTTCASANCWSVYGSALPNAPVVQLKAAAAMATGDGRTGELRAATYGRGIWQIPLLTAQNPAAPVMSVNPGSQTFPAQQVGTLSAAVTVAVTNTGDAALTISGATATGDFVEMDDCAGTPIAPNAGCTVQVEFLPSATGARSGVLTIYGNVAGGQATVALSGNGTTAATIVLTPVMLSFPATSLGVASAVENVTISNTGGTTATLSGESVSGDFSITQNTCGGSLAAQTGCTVSIAFTPTVSGNRGGALTVNDSAGAQTASLSGTGTAPATDGLAPLMLSFGEEALSSASGAQVVTLTNAGDVALTLIAAQITSGGFTVVNGCGNSLNGHASCALSVAFTPRNLGQQSGVLTVSDQFRSQTVALSGIGVAPPGVSLAPVGGLSFAGTAVGAVSAMQTVTLTNNGGQTLHVSGIAVSGDFVIVAGTNSCGATVGIGTACTLQMAFQPSAAGTRAGTLTVASDAPNSPQTLALAGVGVDFSLEADGPVSATISTSQNANFLLLLSSVDGLTGSVDFTCTGAPANALCSVNPASTGLGGQTVITVTVATGVSSAAAVSTPKGQMRWVWAGMLPFFLTVPLLGLLTRRRGGAGLVAAFVACGMLALGGCGTARLIPATAPGGGTTTPPPVTPSGSYALTVTGTSTGLSRTVSLTVVVQ